MTGHMREQHKEGTGHTGSARRFFGWVLLALSCVLPAAAGAQFDAPAQYGLRPPRLWFVVSDGVGPSGGGVAGTTGLSQVLRGAAYLNVARGLGAEGGVLRIQEIVPSVK